MLEKVDKIIEFQVEQFGSKKTANSVRSRLLFFFINLWSTKLSLLRHYLLLGDHAVELQYVTSARHTDDARYKFMPGHSSVHCTCAQYKA